MLIQKTSEKIIVWLHRNKKTQIWLAAELGVNKQSVTNKLTDKDRKSVV